MKCYNNNIFGGAKMKTIAVGIMPEAQLRKRLLDAAAGKYKRAANEPKIWFQSLKSVAEILNENNIKLLTIIDKMKP
jgi:predicted transcriptional regulator